MVVRTFHDVNALGTFMPQLARIVQRKARMAQAIARCGAAERDKTPRMGFCFDKLDQIQYPASHLCVSGATMRSSLYLLLLAMLPLSLGGCINLPLGLMGNNRGKVGLEEIEPAKGILTRDEVLMIPLVGMVREGSFESHIGEEPGMLVALKDRLTAARDNRHLKAVILRIDSPGGTTTAADLIYRELMKFKEEKKVPVIAMMTDTAASGGVYIAMAADEIYALPSTVTGSIGAIMMLPGLQGLSQKIGFEMRVVKSGKNKDIGSPWGAMTAEQRAIFQKLIDDFYHRFYKLVLDSRKSHGMTDELLRPVADGRIMDAQTALSAKLIDGIKYPDEVIARAKELAGVQDARVVSYEYPFNYRGHIYAQSGVSGPRAENANGGDINLLKLDMQNPLEMLAGGQFYYMWVP
jgi:protease-4